MTPPRDVLVITLPPGAQQALPLPTDTLVVVREGTLQLSGPLQALAGLAWQPRRRLTEGELDSLPHAGWVQLQAGPTGAQLWLIRPPKPAWQQALDRVLDGALEHALHPARRRLGSVWRKMRRQPTLDCGG